MHTFIFPDDIYGRTFIRDNEAFGVFVVRNSIIIGARKVIKFIECSNAVVGFIEIENTPVAQKVDSLTSFDHFGCVSHREVVHPFARGLS